MKYALALSLLLNFSLTAFAQGKIYIVPTIGFYSGSYRGVDSINNKQDYIRTKPFFGKNFIYGVRLSYVNDNLGLSAGIENGHYSTGFKHFQDYSNPRSVESKEILSRSIAVFFQETRFEVANLNLKKPKWLKRSAATDKPYLLVSRIATLIGFEFRRMDNTFVQDFPNSSEISTSQGDILGIHWFHLNNGKLFSMRTGFDWVFYDQEKRTFIISLIYSFAFEDAGYYHYRFNQDTPEEFQYRNNTRGNGFSLKVGVPICIFKNKKP
ncbi:MAG TPA: hypothetical protein VEY06_00440 [Flavisolibacter sp.]|nr:hypothetical protein [Flavisolibacter sp.]